MDVDSVFIMNQNLNVQFANSCESEMSVWRADDGIKAMM